MILPRDKWSNALRAYVLDTYRAHISQLCSRIDWMRAGYILILVFQRTFFWFHNEWFGWVKTLDWQFSPKYLMYILLLGLPKGLGSWIQVFCSIDNCSSKTVGSWDDVPDTMTFVFKELIFWPTRKDSSDTSDSMDWVSEEDSANKLMLSV